MQQFFAEASIQRLAAVLYERLGFATAAPEASNAPIPIAHDGPIPLSYTQELAWVMHQLESRSGVLLLLARVQLQGQLNVAALEQSLNEIIRRHSILRTTFDRVNGQLQQTIAPTLVLSIPVIDLQSLTPTDRAAEVQRLDEQDAMTAFDLSNGPLIRPTLLQLQQHDYLLLLSLHHIVADIASLGILVRELATLYAAYSLGEPSPLLSLSRQYADFAVWQRQMLSGQLEQQIRDWQQQMGELPVVDLPTDYPRPAVPTLRIAIAHSVLSASLTANLKALSRQENLTLFMTLTAALKVLLARYTGQSDLLLLTPVANRQRETEDLIGFFATTLLLRTDLSGNPTVRELLARVRQGILDAYAFQDIPFIKLIETVKADPQHDPLARVWIDMIGNAQSAIEMPDLIAKFTMSNGGFGSKFDLLLGVAEQDTTIELKWIYSVDLFSETTIVRMAGHFQTILEEIVLNLEQRLADVSLLTTAEQQQLLMHNKTDLINGSTSNDSRQAEHLLTQLDTLSDEEVNALLNKMMT